jgi:hypothetical protein
MNRDDVIDLLTIVSAADNRQVTAPDIVVWHEHLERYERDECLDAIMSHQRESTEYLQPAHVIQRVRAKRNDMIERADPDDRPHMVGLNGVPRDRYGYVAKGENDEIEYPAEWTSEQRLAHYWTQIENRRDSEALSAQSWDQTAPHMPANADVRANCMRHIRSVLAR